MNSSKTSSTLLQPKPPNRKIRAYAFDPILSRKIETYETNQITINLKWEETLEKGPVDKYIEVVDYDPASKRFYKPINLNHPNLLAQNGLSPSEGNPQFHQQMVYAVTRKTIDHFEKALGRKALWSPRITKTNNGWSHQNITRLRVYPHAIREANAYYSPTKKAILYGYFPASTIEPGENMPGGTVFTCLSHDIIAHETAHALLDGLHRRFIEPTNEDVWALHEAFADIIALFQHFTYPKVLAHQIALTRGDLEKQNLLGKLAYQLGHAIGNYGALRDALGMIDKDTNEWIPEKPDPEKIHQVTEPHNRGAILVAAVFDAFLTIYRWRARDLMRIATGGTGVLPPGDIHPDLVQRLAKEASKTAGHVLQICIRALDYCPPVDVDFGDYLRALITADYELVTVDRLNYRIAFIEAFRKRGIIPRDVHSLAQENLNWPSLDDEEQKSFEEVFGSADALGKILSEWSHSSDRDTIFEQMKKGREELHTIFRKESPDAAVSAGLILDSDVPKGVFVDDKGIPTLEVHSVRPCRRIGPDGQTVTELLIEMTQRRRGYLNAETQEEVDKGNKKQVPDFIFRGGTTIIIDLESKKVKYCISKDLLDEERLKKVRKYLSTDKRPSIRSNYIGRPQLEYFRNLIKREDGYDFEPFALLHRDTWEDSI